MSATGDALRALADVVDRDQTTGRSVTDAFVFLAVHGVPPEADEAERIDLTIWRSGAFTLHMHRTSTGDDEPIDLMEASSALP